MRIILTCLRKDMNRYRGKKAAEVAGEAAREMYSKQLDYLMQEHPALRRLLTGSWQGGGVHESRKDLILSLENFKAGLKHAIEGRGMKTGLQRM
jgi:hypothetical protein